MIAIITFPPIAEERRSCSHCVGRHLQSSALLLFNAFPTRGSQPVSHIKHTPECLNTAAEVSAQKNQKTFLITEQRPSPSHCFLSYDKKTPFCSWASALWDAIFLICYCIVQRDLKTTSSFQYKSMQSARLLGMNLLALPSLFPHGEILFSFLHGSVLTTLLSFLSVEAD